MDMRLTHPTISHFRPEKTNNLCQIRTKTFPALRPSKTCFVARSEGNNGSKTFGHLESLTCNLSAFPNCEFFRVEAIIRPWRLDLVVGALAEKGIVAVTSTRVKGAGAQGGTKERYSGKAHDTKELVEKAKLDVVVFRDQVDTVARTIALTAYTGEIGDVSCKSKDQGLKIRTGETGVAAQKMAGGMTDRA